MKERKAAQGGCGFACDLLRRPNQLQGRHGGNSALPANSHADPKHGSQKERHGGAAALPANSHADSLNLNSKTLKPTAKAPMGADLCLGPLAMIWPLGQGFRLGFTVLKFGACVCCSCARFVRSWVRFVFCWGLVLGLSLRRLFCCPCACFVRVRFRFVRC